MSIAILWTGAALAEETTPYDFSLLDQDGKVVQLSQIKDPIVVLEWTNPECPFVKPHYQENAMTMVKLAQTYKAKKVTWLAINSSHFSDQAQNKAWHTEKKLPYPVLDDHTGKVGMHFQAKTTPHIFVLNQARQVVYQGAIDNNPRGQNGGNTINYVQEILDDLTAGKEPRIHQTKSYGCSVKYAPK
jgi:peroxiredoxin